jgi:hypothetical protein
MGHEYLPAILVFTRGTRFLTQKELLQGYFRYVKGTVLDLCQVHVSPMQGNTAIVYTQTMAFRQWYGSVR